MISPITGDENLDAFLYKLNDDVLSMSAMSSTTFTNPAAGTATGYPYRYMHVKYADDNIGTGFSNSQTNKAFFGIYNSDSSTESGTAAEYTWFEVKGGFGTTNYLWYIVTAGRQFSYYVSFASPGTLYTIDPGTAIDLNLISTVATQSARMAYTLVFDLLSASPSFYTSTGSLSVPPINTWGGGETWTTTIPLLSPGSTMYQSDGNYDSTTGLTTWGRPYLAKLKVGSLTANNLIVGNSPAISGTTMTGSGALIKTDGTFALGDSTRNIVNNGSQININGFTPVITGSVITGNLLGATVGTYTGDINVRLNFPLQKNKFLFNMNGSFGFVNTAAISRHVFLHFYTLYKQTGGGGYIGGATNQKNSQLSVPVTAEQYFPFSISEVITMPGDGYSVDLVIRVTITNYDVAGIPQNELTLFEVHNSNYSITELIL